MSSRTLAWRLGGAALTLLGGGAAHAQDLFPFGQGFGVTRLGDRSFDVNGNFGSDYADPTIALAAGEFSVVAFEFVAPVCDYAAPAHAATLNIPVGVSSGGGASSQPITLDLWSYDGDGTVEGGDFAAWNYDAVFVGSVVIPPGTSATTLSFATSFVPLQGNYPGYFLSRGASDPLDGQVVTVHNGGATLVPADAYPTCIWNPAGLPVSIPAWMRMWPCADGSGDEGIVLEFDGACTQSSCPDTDPMTGEVSGIDVTPISADNYPSLSPYIEGGAAPIMPGYEVDLSGVTGGPLGNVRLTVVYCPLDVGDERQYEQNLQVWHDAAHDGNFQEVMSDAMSNLRGNDDGGWVTTIWQSSASPFIVGVAKPPVDRCHEVVAGAFGQPMGSRRKLGTTLPIKVGLAAGGALTSLSDLGALGLAAPRVRIYDVTNGGPGQRVIANVDLDRTSGTGDTLRASNGQWVFDLALDAANFGAGRTYEVRLALGACELVPTNATFQTR